MLAGGAVLLVGYVCLTLLAVPSPAQSYISRTLQLPENDTTALAKKCYGIYGCFAITKEWISLSRPVSVLPQGPKQVNVKFCLYTFRNPTDCEHMYDNDIQLIQSSSFLAGRPVKFLIHGYLDSGDKRWIKRMVAALLAKEDVNVFVVDWVGGSGPPYTQAVANIRLVGAVVGHFIHILRKLYDTDVKQVHVIGHSLGAHLAGYVGAYLRARKLTLGRITGLDPAQPHFENTASVVRLDPTDAAFVDVIHTDSGPIISGGMGLNQPVGHMDFYPNGGKRQPGCGSSVFEAIKMEDGSLIYGLRRFIGCNHLRAYEYFTESIQSGCSFLAYECDSYESFTTGKCTGCDPNRGNCHQMGFHANSKLTPNDFYKIHRQNSLSQEDLFGRPLGGRSFFLMTGKTIPFCRRHFLVTLHLSDIPAAVQQGGDMGVFRIRFVGRNNRTHWHRLNEVDFYFEPGHAYTYVSPVSMVGELVGVDLEWGYSSHLLNPLTWRLLSQSRMHINRVLATDMEQGRSYVFCGEDRPLMTGRSARLLIRPRCRHQSAPPTASSLYAALANLDLVGGVGDSVAGLVESDANVIPTRRRRRRRRWWRTHSG